MGGSDGVNAATAAESGTASTDGDAATVTVDVGILVAHSPAADPERLQGFARRLADDVVGELAASTDADWRFALTDPAPLPGPGGRRPSDFVDDAADRMVAGPYDLVVVVTDVPLRSRTERRVPGLASPVSRIAVVSTRHLLLGPRKEPTRTLDAPAVRYNAAALLLHLVGHLLGQPHDRGGTRGDATDQAGNTLGRRGDAGEHGGDRVMAPFVFDPDRRAVPDFDADVSRRLARLAGELPQADTATRSTLGRVAFSLRCGLRNADQVAGALVRSRAPLVPLSLPRLATAAVTPTLILVFSAEAWDVGVHLSNATAAAFAVASVVIAAVHLFLVQNLAFPREPNRVLTEHMAVVNVTVFAILLGAALGLFALVWAVMLLIELAIFPPDLMSTWPSLEDPAVGVLDLVRTGAFIATLGVLSGALAGGLEERSVLHHVALFRDRP